MLVVLIALLWSSAGVLVKLVSWNPIAIAGMRSAIAAIVVFVFLRRSHRYPLRWSKLQIGGAIAFAGSQIFFISAIRLTTAANAVFLQYAAPIYIAIFGAWFLKERASRLDWITIAVIIAGMMLFFGDDLTTDGYWGNIFGILSGICFAWLIMFVRKGKDESALQIVFLGNIITALVALPFMFESAPSLSDWGGLVLLGVFNLGLPWVLYAVAIKHLQAIEAVLIQTLEPITNPLWVFLIVGETIGSWALLGGTIVLVSVTCRGLVMAREVNWPYRHIKPS